MSDFEKFWNNEDEDNNFIEPLPFPRDHKELAEWCKIAYEAGRKAGLEEAAEIADEYGVYQEQTSVIRRCSAAIRERMK